MNALVVFFLSAAADPQSVDHAGRARAFVEQMRQGQFASAVESFDETMRKAMPADKLKETWGALIKQAGGFQSAEGTRSEKQGKYEVLFVTCRFEKTKLDVRVAFNSDDKIGGFGFQPTKSAVEYKAPEYVKTDARHERALEVPIEGLPPLGATLTIPNGKGPFPGVVLVHGSGPQDRDETIGPNKPFRDLADGLASQGIAVLRYEKRTRALGPQLNPATITIKEETIDDALSAVRLLRQQPEIDAAHVYLLGHSLGAMVAPRIAAADGKLAGIVIMAGAARPLEDVILDQFEYLAKTDSHVREMLTKLKEQVARVKDQKLGKDAARDDLPLGVPAAYWLALRGLKPADEAANLRCRILVLHGDRDYQVTLDDFQLFERALHGNTNATLRRFENLNHLFVEGTGKATPAEYEKAGHVSRLVIDLIAHWIQRG